MSSLKQSNRLRKGETMSISIGSNSLYSSSASMDRSKVKTEKLESTLNSATATDDELMEACKSFESYLVEQVFKGMQKTVLKDEEEESDYISQFGDMLYTEYAEEVTNSQGLGIAQMLYESMKRNGESKKPIEEVKK